MPEDGFGYDETLSFLRSSLVEAAGNARGFAIRSRARPTMLSARTWAELAEIEEVLAKTLLDVLRLELHEEPWSLPDQARAFAGGLWTALRPEPGLVRERFQAALDSPVEAWRKAAPQLEASLWPFFVDRTHHLANTLALALAEPAPHPALFWHVRQRRFQRQ